MIAPAVRASRKESNQLFWLIPIIYGITVELLLLSLLVAPGLLLNHTSFVLPFVAPACVVNPFGGFWALYQCLRYERHFGRYLAIIFFVPLSFTWYYFEKYRMRRSGFDRLPGW